MKKLFGLITIFCFFITNIGFALSPALMTDDLGGETYHYGFFSLWKLQSDLLILNNIADIRGLKGKDGEERIKEIFSDYKNSYKEDTIFNPAEATTFFNLVENVGGNIFSVPIHAKKDEKHENYLMLFSTVRDEANQGFPVTICERGEFERLKSKIAEQNTLPVREKEKQKLLGQVTTRHIEQNEKIIDKFIRERMEEGNFAEIKGRAKELRWDDKYPDRICPEKGKGEYWRDEIWEYAKKELNPFLGHFGISVDKALEGKNIVFLNVPEGVNYPVIEEDEKSLTVESHTSENAVYFFVSNFNFKTLSQILNIEKGEKERRYTGIEDSRAPLTLFKGEFKNCVIYEIGVIYDMPFKIYSPVQKIYKTMNDLSAVYQGYDYFGQSIESLKTKPKWGWKETEDKISKGKVNLNHLYARGNLRDYAKGEKRVQDEKSKRKSDNKSRLMKLVAVGLWNSEAFFREKKSMDMEGVISGLHDININAKARGILYEADTRLRVYLDLISINLISTGKIKEEEIKIEDSIAPELLSRSLLLSLLTDNFPKELDSLIREEAIRIGKQVEERCVPAEILKDIYDERNPVYPSSEKVMELRDKLRQWTYGCKNVLVPDFDIAHPIAVWLEKFWKEKENKYWQTVEEDIAAFWKAGLVEEVEKDGEIKLLDEWLRNVDAIKQKFESLPLPLRCWMQKTNTRITGKVFYGNEYWPDTNQDQIARVITEYVTECLKKARDTKLYKIKDQFYVSPRTKELSHVCRAIKQKEPAIYIGEKLYKKLSEGNYVESSALLLFNEAMHIGHLEVSHGLIGNTEDIGIKNDHVQLPFLKELEKNHISEMPKPWDTYMHKGGDIYKSQSMINFFESVKRFMESKTQNVLFINAKSGSGASMAAKFMKVAETAMKTIDCAALHGCSGDRLHELWFGNEGIFADIAEVAKRNQPMLLVMDHLEYADEALQTKLLTLVREEGSITTGQGKTDIADLRKKLKIVCFFDGSKKMVLNADLARKLGEPLDLPLLQFRGDDIVLLAEYFNSIESEANGIAWAPFEESFGKLIAKLAVTEDGEIQVSELRRFVQKLVEARKYILNEIEDTGILPYRALRGSVIPSSIEKVFCKYLMTTCDMVYSSALIVCFGNRGGAAKIVYGDRKKNIESEIIQAEVERFTAGNNYLFPYFKDELAPRITKESEALGFYKGIPGEQPGMTRKSPAVIPAQAGIYNKSITLPYEYEISGLNWGSLKATLKRYVPKSDKLLANFGKGSALIFSEKITFDKGAGPFLPKFVKAGMKVAVVAKTDKQREKIEELNREMLADSENKIIVLEDVSEAMSRMPGAQRYYYFTINADNDSVKIEGIIKIDISHMVDQIIQALAEANNVYSTSTIQDMKLLADQFRQSV